MSTQQESHSDDEEELLSLKKQHFSLKTFCEEAKKENAFLKQQISALSPLVPPKDNTLDNSEQKNNSQEIQTFLEQNKYLKEQLEECSSQLARKEKMLLQSQSEILALRQEKQLLADKEANLKIAQQHLAKKMRENACLFEKNEEQKFQIQELQRSLIESQNKFSALQHSLDAQLHNEKRLQEQFKEIIKNSDAQIKRWEEKYFHMQEKWQESEEKNKFLKTIEDKHRQLQLILANVESLLNVPYPNAIGQQNLNIKNESSSDEGLFEKQSSSTRYKNHLFE